MKINKLSKTDLKTLIKSINVRLLELEWIECVNNVKLLPSKIDFTNINDILSTRILADRFMVFDVSREMRLLEKKLTGKITQGLNLHQIREAFKFYDMKFKI